MIFSMIIFALAYPMKGGQFKIHFSKAFATAMVFAFSLQYGFAHASIMAVAWLLATRPSMGEEAGAIGNFRYGWGKYLEWMPSFKIFKIRNKFFGYIEGRLYGINKAVQRGSWMGSVFTMAGILSPVIPDEKAYIFIPVLTIAFPLCHYIAQGIYYKFTNRNDWKYAEPMIGLFIGLCAGLLIREA